MTEPVVDLFKFVALRSPAEPATPAAGRVADDRVLLRTYYPLPDVETDGGDFQASPAATEVHGAVGAALAVLGSPAGIPAANRAIAKAFAAGPIGIEPETARHVEAFVATVAGRTFDDMSDVVGAIEEALSSFSDWNLENYAGGDSPPLKWDLAAAFDALYRAYVAKQVRPLDLTPYFAAIAILAAIGHVWGDTIREPEAFQRSLTALPVIHPMFALLLGYYKPFNPIQPIGIGDLLVVKQFLRNYEAGEIAHVENVLKGERKSRTHRRLDRTEETFTAEEETTEETIRELQSSERFELKAETESTIRNDLNVEMSGQVSGRYGVVEVSASAGVSYSLSTSDARRGSNNFAKDVIDRSVSRIQRRATETRSLRRTHEIEEINLHELNNTPPGSEHVTGIYRWLDKRYDAQVFNYGKRLMFEFVLPEPAAFILQAFDRNKKLDSPPGIPQPPAKPELVISQITQAQVDAWAQIYTLGDVRAEPAAGMTITRVASGSGLGGETATSHEKQFDIPEGYAVDLVRISGGYEGVNVAGQGWDWGLYMSIGGKTAEAVHLNGAAGDTHQSFGERTLTFPVPMTGSLSVSILAYRVVAFEVSVALELTLTAQARRAWQIGAYNAIMDAYGRAESEYRSLLTEYQDRLDSYRAGEGVTIRGRNERINQEIIRTELRKSCLSLIALQFDSDRNDDIVFDAMKTRDEEIEQGAVARKEITTVSTSHPDETTTVTVTTKTISEETTVAKVPVKIAAVDVTDAVDEGRTVQFLEQAFEWQQLSYVLYPYFWGRLPEKWFDAQRYYDETDPLFARFLQAGAARVLIAARPGFETAVMHYLRTRQPWNGGPAPDLDDPLYLAIHEELRGQQDDLNGAEPYGESWEVVLPTSLVLLQETADLPTFTQDGPEA